MGAGAHALDATATNMQDDFGASSMVYTKALGFTCVTVASLASAGAGVANQLLLQKSESLFKANLHVYGAGVLVRAAICLLDWTSNPSEWGVRADLSCCSKTQHTISTRISTVKFCSTCVLHLSTKDLWQGFPDSSVCLCQLTYNVWACTARRHATHVTRTAQTCTSATNIYTTGSRRNCVDAGSCIHVHGKHDGLWPRGVSPP